MCTCDFKISQAPLGKKDNYIASAHVRIREAGVKRACLVCTVTHLMYPEAVNKSTCGIRKVACEPAEVPVLD